MAAPCGSGAVSSPSRSVSVEERRLRGVDVVEPLGVPLFGAARVDAITTGLAEDDEEQHGDRNTLLPAVPLNIADAVATDVLRDGGADRRPAARASRRGPRPAGCAGSCGPS